MYDYRQAMHEDIKQWIDENREEYPEILKIKTETERSEADEKLYDILWAEDSITGNGSGSYTFNREKARKYLTGNEELVRKMIEFFDVPAKDVGQHFLNNDYEWFDVSIRCMVMGEVLHNVLMEIMIMNN